MDLYLIKSYLTSAWTTSLHYHGKCARKSAFYFALDVVALPKNFMAMTFSTPPRIFRQVASLMGLQLVTSFINVAKMLGAQRETTQRQLNAEKKKKTDGPRVESLNKRLSMTHENITVIEEMMRKLFTGFDILLFYYSL